MLDTAHKFKLGSEVRHIIYDIDTDVLNEVSFQIPYIHLIIYLSKFGQVLRHEKNPKIEEFKLEMVHL